MAIAYVPTYYREELQNDPYANRSSKVKGMLSLVSLWSGMGHCTDGWITIKMELGKANTFPVQPSDLTPFSMFNCPQVLLTDDGDNYGDE